MGETLRRVREDGEAEHTFQRRPGFSGTQVMDYTHELRRQAKQLHDMALEITSVPCSEEQTAVKLLIQRVERVS